MKPGKDWRILATSAPPGSQTSPTQVLIDIGDGMCRPAVIGQYLLGPRPIDQEKLQLFGNWYQVGEGLPSLDVLLENVTPVESLPNPPEPRRETVVEMGPRELVWTAEDHPFIGHEAPTLSVVNSKLREFRSKLVVFSDLAFGIKNWNWRDLPYLSEILSIPPEHSDKRRGDLFGCPLKSYHERYDLAYLSGRSAEDNLPEGTELGRLLRVQPWPTVQELIADGHFDATSVVIVEGEQTHTDEIVEALRGRSAWGGDQSLLVMVHHPNIPELDVLPGMALTNGSQEIGIDPKAPI